MATYYAFDGESLYVEGYFANQILNTTNKEQEFWMLGAERMGMNPHFVNERIILNGRKYTRKKLTNNYK